MRGQDLLSPLRQFQRRVAVIGSVANLIANNPGGLLAMSGSGGDGGEVESWNLFVGCGGGRDLGRLARCLEVAFGNGISGDEVGEHKVALSPRAIRACRVADWYKGSRQPSG